MSHASVVSIIASFLLCGASACQAQETDSLTVREMVAQKNDWDKWAQSKKLLRISGRFGGRAGRQFRLDRLNVQILPSRTTLLPLNLTADQRLSVKGVLRKEGTRYFLDATGVSAGPTDIARLVALAARVDPRKPSELYELADSYRELAKFYEDKQVQAQIDEMYSNAFALQRKLARGNEDQLLDLLKRGKQLEADPDLLQAIQFEALVTRWKAEPNDSGMLQRIKDALKGWEEPARFSSEYAEKQFMKEMIQEYEDANAATRQVMERRFFRAVRLPEILKQLNKDGSNGNSISTQIKQELPEEEAEIERTSLMYVQWRLKQTPELSRRQLEELHRLLRENGRESEFALPLETWLRAQAERLKQDTLNNLLLLSEEFLFAFDRWKNPRHKDRAVELLKTAWSKADLSAPEVAEGILVQLKQLGHQRLKDRWLTTDAISSLPRNDVDLAMREGRVVAGMTAKQITNTLGEPSRRMRIISARGVHEVWVFREAGSTAVTVHLERERHRKELKARLVTTTTQ